MALKSSLVSFCIGLLLSSLAGQPAVHAQQLAPVMTQDMELPVRLDQWLIQDLDYSSKEHKQGGFHINMASKAWFCVKERELEQWSGIPVRFRLGDQPTVDRLEGK